MLIKWTEDLSVGHETLNQEHQKWIAILNDFYQGLADGSSKEKLTGLIKGLLDYAKVHFSNEEEYMRSIHFPGLERHQQEHGEFIEKATEFYEKFSTGKMLLSIEVTNFIKNWISNHIKAEDKQYARHAGL
ncbi:bacteriohemerythrin [Marinilabilia salmonicolor]|uniref:bacteriohemerythrin n=1 Tax=Marinilabilia salmonicolor TaxID=989 RepID=UPI000299E5A1|nr:bacteriohemerythrin [Marinilabilia salmonicolor]